MPVVAPYRKLNYSVYQWIRNILRMLVNKWTYVQSLHIFIVETV